jgi:outer membrane lipase/esterase
MPNDPPFSCRHPERFLFWDGIHPTKAAHGILAEEAARVLGAD